MSDRPFLPGEQVTFTWRHKPETGTVIKVSGRSAVVAHGRDGAGNPWPDWISLDKLSHADGGH